MDRVRRFVRVGELRLVAKMAGAGTLSWWLATVAGQARPLFAVLVPLVAMGDDPFGALNVSLTRVLGVFAGVALGLGLLKLSASSTAIVAITLGAGLLLGLPLRLGVSRPNIEIAISAIFMAFFGRGSPDSLAVTRVWETAIGPGATVLVAALVWPPDPLGELRSRLDDLRADLGEDLATLAEDLATGDGSARRRLERVREHSLDAVRHVFELDRARGALRWNPLRRGDAPALAEMEVRINLGARLYRHTRALARDVVDADGLGGPGTGAALAAATRAVAEVGDLRLRGADAAAAVARAGEAVDAVWGEGDAAILRAQLRQMLADATPSSPDG